MDVVCKYISIYYKEMASQILQRIYVCISICLCGCMHMCIMQYSYTRCDFIVRM